MSDVPASAEVALAWRATWLPVLIRDRPARVVVAAVLLGAAATGAVVSLPPLAGAALLVAAFVSLDHVLLPVRFRLDTEEVVVRTALRTRHFRWGQFTRARRTEHGVLLASPIRRSLHLLASEQSDEIEAFCLARLAAVAATDGQTAGLGRDHERG